MSYWESYATRAQVVSSWPSNWIWHGNQYFNVTTIVVIAIFSTLLLTLNPFLLVPRLVSFFSSQIYLSYIVSTQGNNYHSHYGFALLSFVFLFLPIQSLSKSNFQFRQRVILCMWFAGAALATIYCLIGLGNVHGGLRQLLQGKTSVFSPVSVAYFILQETHTYSKTNILSDFVIKYHFVFWFGLFASMLSKITALFFLVNVRFLRLFGVGILLFHLFNAFAFGLPFRNLAFQVLLFLILNPIQYCNALGLRKTFRQLRKFILKAPILRNQPN